jgi:hypothetical protein
MLKHALILSVIFAVAAIAASSAEAVAPIRSQYPFDATYVVSDLCSFPVAVATSAEFTEIDFLDQTGDLTRALFHFTAQDTRSANGITLAGLPYTATAVLTVDSSGTVVSAIGTGVFEDIPLPNGDVFFSAGRGELLGRPAVLVPDVGVSGDLGELCAALTP